MEKEKLKEGNNKEEVEKNQKDIKEYEEEIRRLKEELKKYKEISEERLNAIKYLQADFDNYRKKFEKEKEQIIRLANENLIKELIIILDDFESSIQQIKNEEDKKGVELLYKKFMKTLEEKGLKQIEALGKKFNPEFHEVLCKEEKEDEEDEKIIEEIQKGYILNSKVIRASKVKIIKKQNKEN
jgi:molecular chaperone GrpE